MVVAADRYQAEDAAALIEVEYDVLPAVVELADSRRRPGRRPRRRARQHCGKSRGQHWRPGCGLRRGRADRERSSSRSSAASPARSRVAAWRWNGTSDRRRMHVWASTQAPVALKFGLCRLLGLGSDELHLEAPDVGGGFGSKIMVFYPEEVLLPYAALRLGRNVKWTEDRWEHFVSANQERGQIHDAEIAFDSTGRIQAVRTHFLHDSGAYTPYGSDVCFNTVTHVLGQYRIPNFKATAEVRYTNKPPVSPYRGAGRPQAVFVMERLIGAVARRLGMDPERCPATEPHPGGCVSLRDRPPHQGSGYLRQRQLPGRLPDGHGSARARCFQAPAGCRRGIEGRYLGMGVGTYVEATAPARSEGCSARLEGSGKLVDLARTAFAGPGPRDDLRPDRRRCHSAAFQRTSSCAPVTPAARTTASALSAAVAW